MKIIKRGLRFLHRNIFPSSFYATRSYSQEGEDVLLNGLYKNDGKKNYIGFYIDVGAHHPLKISNTALFYKKGWNGINIEANPILLKEFQRFRKRDINLNIAIGMSDKPLNFYAFKYPEFSGFDEKISMARKASGAVISAVLEIQPLKLSEVLDKYIDESKKIDFLSIDVEGLDLEVLQSNNWDKYIPEFIIVEILNCENIEEDKVHQFLLNKKYNLVGKTYRSYIYRLHEI